MQNEKVVNHIVNWLSNYLKDAGMHGFVVGVSGGVDSALTSTLCTLTGTPVHLISMPIHQNKSQLQRAEEHIEALIKKFDNVTRFEIDLSNTFETLKMALPESVKDGMTMANTRSRLRMTCLYTFAQGHRLLVAGTGNKVEDFGVGFFTKYGDGGVDISPIADLYKTEVFALAAHLGISQSILDAPPTDGLWDDDRTDEDQIGATYAEIEWAMDYLKITDNTMKLSKRQEEVLEIYLQFQKRNKHKMQPIPVCKIPKTFFNAN